LTLHQLLVVLISVNHSRLTWLKHVFRSTVDIFNQNLAEAFWLHGRHAMTTLFKNIQIALTTCKELVLLNDVRRASSVHPIFVSEDY